MFEGSEKRVEIDFNYSAASPANGLRALSRAQLDELMGLAACTIVSSRTNNGRSQQQQQPPPLQQRQLLSASQKQLHGAGQRTSANNV